MAPIPTRRVPFAKLPEYEVVWNGTSTTFGERGQLLPETHAVSSTWGPSVERLRKRVDVINKRELNGG